MERRGVSDDAKSSVRDEASRLLDDGTCFDAEMTDIDIQRYCVSELLPDGVDKSDAFVQAAFRTLTDGDARVVQIARRFRQQQLGILRHAKIEGWPH